MKKFFIPLIILFISFASQAHAAKMHFGNQDSINFIQDVDIRGAKQEQLYLGYKTSTYFFILGIYMIDHGYVLGVKNNKAYYKLTQTQLSQFQQQGLLPSPLPKYQIDWFTYAIGYSLWIAIAGLIAWFFFSSYFDKRKAEKDYELLLKTFPKVISGAIIADGNVTNSKLQFAQSAYENIFSRPLDQQELHASLQWASESQDRYNSYIGGTCKGLKPESKNLLLQIYAQILMLDGIFTPEERNAMEVMAKRMRLPNKAVKSFLASIDQEIARRQNQAVA